MKRKISIILTTAIAAVVFSGCNGKGKMEIEQPIEQPVKAKSVSHGPKQDNGNYRCDIDKGDATLIKPGQSVKPLTKDTRLRVWHYQNSDEYICLLKGEAVVLSD